MVLLFGVKTNARPFTQFLKQKLLIFTLEKILVMGHWVHGGGGKWGMLILYVNFLSTPQWGPFLFQISFLPIFPCSGLLILNLSISHPCQPSPGTWTCFISLYSASPMSSICFPVFKNVFNIVDYEIQAFHFFHTILRDFRRVKWLIHRLGLPSWISCIFVYK